MPKITDPDLLLGFDHTTSKTIKMVKRSVNSDAAIAAGVAAVVENKSASRRGFLVGLLGTAALVTLPTPITTPATGVTMMAIFSFLKEEWDVDTELQQMLNEEV